MPPAEIAPRCVRARAAHRRRCRHFLGANGDGAPRARVLAKMDVEGMEYDLIPAAAPLLCKTVDVLMLERHDRFFSERARREG